MKIRMQNILGRKNSRIKVLEMETSLAHYRNKQINAEPDHGVPP